MTILANISKSLYDISWQVSEEVYRADEALSYSTLAKYERSGFNGLPTLFDKIETPSLTFGSAVDSIITGGQKEFDNRFLVAKIPSVPAGIVPIVKSLFLKYSSKYNSLDSIPDTLVIQEADLYNYQSNWRPETRAKVIKEKASELYKIHYLAGDKTIISDSLYSEICASVDALRTNSNTKFYFAANNPWESVERFYQLKFKAALNGIAYRCMADLIVVDHEHKTIQPIDLKTSSKAEWDFYKSFIDWDYAIQARLYWRIIRDILDKDPFYKDYKLLDYIFIVINRHTLTPLTWVYEDTQLYGTLIYGKFKQIICRDPFEIGKELNTYLINRPKVPLTINTDKPNMLKVFLDTI